MELKQEIIRILEENRGKSISGTQIAKELHVTRSAIWKNIKQLQEEGYHIEAASNRGYLLSESNDILTAESISPYLKGKALYFTLDVKKTVTSTNTLAKEMAAKGAPSGSVLIALEQTKGRGRMGRSFYSPNSTGLYLSIILRPDLSLEDSLLITTSAAVAVAKAIEKLTGNDVDIKWVNDLFMKGKKVCGILTEASLNVESGGLEYAVVGIGINVSTKDFPDKLQKVAGSIFSDKPDDRPITSLLAAQVLNNLAEAMDNITDLDYLKEYKKRSFLIGEDIFVLKGKDSYPAKAIDIDERARLVVEYSNGDREHLLSGEVSVRIKPE